MSRLLEKPISEGFSAFRASVHNYALKLPYNAPTLTPKEKYLRHLYLLFFAQHFCQFGVEDKFGSGMFWTFARLKVVGTTFLLINTFGTIPYTLFGFCPLINSCQL